MFEGDLTALSTADLLESAAEHRAEANRAEARLLEHAQVFADRHHPDACPARPGRRGFDGRERAVVLGGDGCPEIAEFAPAEFAVMLGVSPGVAAGFIGEALALRHRFPFTWAKVRGGEATPWKARKIATACLKLSEDAARYVDQRVAGIVDSITPYRLDKIVKAAMMHADPATARAEAEEKRRERGVFVGRTNDHGTKTIYIRAGAGAVNRFDARIAAIADALRALGDSRGVDTRRAEAVDVIHDPAFTEELLHQTRNQSFNGAAPADAPSPGVGAGDSGAGPTGPGAASATSATPADCTCAATGSTGRVPAGGGGTGWERVGGPASPVPEPPAGSADEDLCGWGEALHGRLAQIKHQAHTRPTSHGGTRGRLRPGKTEVYVHLTDHTLATGAGVLRVEDLGPLLTTQLAELVGHGPYVVKPVIDLNDAVSVDGYEIPDRIRERVKLIHPAEMFPYGTRETHRTMDLDHIEPYDPLGPPDQTSTVNLAPMGRFSHRVKTHARGWSVRRVDLKTIEWKTPNGFTFHVDATGTHRVPEPGPDA